MNIEAVKPGQSFSILSVEYRLVRSTGEYTDVRVINRWGRATGDRTRALKVVVERKRHDGRMTRPHYMHVPVSWPIRVSA